MKMELAALIRSMQRDIMKRKQKHAAEQLNELSIKLAEDHFTLAALGQFKRGKSSLMNAILGSPLLPAGILPLTSAIIIIKYGPVEKLIVSQDNSLFKKELPIEQLAEYVTEKENPSNIKQVRSACIELPLPILRRGVEFVDTPGIGSAITANTATTYSFLPQCDAVMFVMSADSPVTSTELDFLHSISSYVEKFFFVINKIDMVEASEVEQILDFTGTLLSKELHCQDILLFPVSAQAGLEAKCQLDETAYAASGLKALEEELALFLAKESGHVFLLKVVRQVLRLADAARYESNELQHFIQQYFPNVTFSQTAAFVEKKITPILTPEPAYVFPAFNVLQDVYAHGCPVCQYIAKATFDFLAWYQYQLSTEQTVQNQLAEAGGMCSSHTWQIYDMASSYDFSLGYISVAEKVAAKLYQSVLQGHQQSVLPVDNEHCFVCHMLIPLEKAYIQDIYHTLQSADGKRAYSQSEGLCLAHLKKMIAITKEDELIDFLLNHAAQHFERWAEDMKAFVLKQETLHRDLQNDNERKACYEVLVHLSGGK